MNSIEMLETTDRPSLCHKQTTKLINVTSMKQRAVTENMLNHCTNLEML
jgi:hypothetical protein